MPKQVEIAPDVRAVLERGTWPDPAIFRLPDGQLDRKLYEGVNKVLVALGGKWDRKVQGHRFSADARQALETALTNGVAVDQKRTMEQFFTPAAIADQLVELAMPGDGDEILEPSAGGGALIEALLRGGVLPAQITAVELDRDLYGALFQRFGPQARMVMCADFMALPVECRFDVVVMNPPFGRGADMAHVTRALACLKPGGRLAAIMSPHWGFASDQASQAFRDLVEDHDGEWTPLPEGSFRESGTGVNSGILIITKGAN